MYACMCTSIRVHLMYFQWKQIHLYVVVYTMYMFICTQSVNSYYMYTYIVQVHRGTVTKVRLKTTDVHVLTYLGFEDIQGNVESLYPHGELRQSLCRETG